MNLPYRVKAELGAPTNDAVHCWFEVFGKQRLGMLTSGSPVAGGLQGGCDLDIVAVVIHGGKCWEFTDHPVVGYVDGVAGGLLL